MLGAATARGPSPRGTRRCASSHQLPIWTLRRFLSGERLWHNPTQPAVLAGVGDELRLRRREPRRHRLRRARRRLGPDGDGRLSAGRPARARGPARARRVLVVAVGRGVRLRRHRREHDRHLRPARDPRRPARPRRREPARARPGAVHGGLPRPGRGAQLWGAWCGPCRAEAPALDQVAEGVRAARGAVPRDRRPRRARRRRRLRPRPRRRLPVDLRPAGPLLLVLQRLSGDGGPVDDRARPARTAWRRSSSAPSWPRTCSTVVDRIAAEPAPAS